MTPGQSLAVRILSRLLAEPGEGWVRRDDLVLAVRPGRRSVAAAADRQIERLRKLGRVETRQVRASALVGLRLVVRASPATRALHHEPGEGA